MSDANFEIRAAWPKATEAGARDAAHLSIHVGTSILTQLAEVEVGTVRNYLRASAVSLAFWFSDNWWRLRWEPLHDKGRPSADWRLKHELSSISGGTIWPPIMIYSTGNRIQIAPTFGANISNGPVRYIDRGTVHAISGAAFEHGVDDFFELVLGNCADARDADALDGAIRQVREERADQGLANWRRLEAQLGYDPDEAPDELIESLSAMEDRLGEEAVEEAAIAAPGAQSLKILQAAVESSENSGLETDLSAAEAIAPKIFDSAGPAWQQAEDAARAVRDLIGVPHGAISDDTIGDLLNFSWGQLKSIRATAGHLPYGARLRGKGLHQKVALQTKASVDRRFELARIFGDAIWTSAGSFGVISRAKTERQKFQRAFAQSLHCPFSDLRRTVDLANPTEDQIQRAAKIFQVHPNVVRTLLVNKGILPRETLEERLEAA